MFVQNQDFLTIHGTLPKIADHDGILVSFHSTRQKEKPRTRTVYEYNKLNEEALIKYIKSFDFETNIFSYPLTEQPKRMTNILTGVFQQFVSSKEVEIRPNAPAWTNSYTRLLQRRKNRNYTLYKKANAKYLKAQANVSVSMNQETTQLMLIAELTMHFITQLI